LTIRLLTLLLAIPATGTGLFARTAPAESGGQGIDLKSLATSVKPCQDFYEYANGRWFEQNPIPADRSSWGAGSQLFGKNLTVLHQILEDAAKDTSAPAGSVTRKVGDFYRAAWMKRASKPKARRRSAKSSRALRQSKT
jgi:putative endopeptidase